MGAEAGLRLTLASIPLRGRRRKVDEGRRQLLEVADVAAEVFLAPLFVVLVPLQVALSLQLQTVGVLAVQGSGCTGRRASVFLPLPAPLGAGAARGRLLGVMAAVVAVFPVI